MHRQAASEPRPASRTRRTSTRPGRRRTAARPRSSRGFLVAMQANPLTTSVARQFLSERAQATWKPNRGTIVYEAFSVVPDAAGGAQVRLADTRRLDARGGWRGGAPGRSETLDLRLVSRGRPVAHRQPGERAGRAHLVLRPQLRAVQPLLLRPDRPRAAARPGLHPARRADGDQPGPRPARRSRRGARATSPARRFPSRTDLDLSVVVTESGVAEVPLSREVLQADARRAVPGGRPARLDAAPGARASSGCGSPSAAHRCRCPSGRHRRARDRGHRSFDAAGTGAARSCGALRGGRVVDLGRRAGGRRRGGPLGRPGYAMRSFAVSESPRRSRRSPATARRSSSRRPRRRSGSGRCRARWSTAPTCCVRRYDMFGDLWLSTAPARAPRVMRGRAAGRCARCGVPGRHRAGRHRVLGRPRRQPAGRGVRRQPRPRPCGWSTSCAPTRASSRAPAGLARSPPEPPTPPASSTSAGATRPPSPCSAGPTRRDQPGQLRLRRRLARPRRPWSSPASSAEPPRRMVVAPGPRACRCC